MLADGVPQTPDELPAATDSQPRLVRERLGAQAASDYCEHDDGRYGLTPEQAACLADASTCTFVAGGPLVSSSVQLIAGGRVADIGCGSGAPLMLLANAYPASTFIGFDYHALRDLVAEAGFSRSGRAAETPTFMVLEGRP